MDSLKEDAVGDLALNEVIWQSVSDVAATPGCLRLQSSQGRR
jgi:hypothetical protein